MDGESGPLMIDRGRAGDARIEVYGLREPILRASQ